MERHDYEVLENGNIGEKWNELLNQGIIKVQDSINNKITVEEEALKKLRYLLYQLLEELITTCEPLTAKDIEEYINRAFPADKFNQGCIEKGRAAFNKVKRRGTISRRTTDGLKLKFSVEHIFVLSRTEWPKSNLKYPLIVFMLAVLEHTCATILQRAGTLATRLEENISLRTLNVSVDYHEPLKLLFTPDRLKNTAKPTCRAQPAQTYEEAVRRFMWDQKNYIRELQILVTRILPIFEDPESGLDADTVDLIFGNIKDILLFEVVFQNDLEQAKEMVRDDLSVLVGCVFEDKALADEYDVYVYYANNYPESRKKMEYWFKNPDFVDYLTDRSKIMGFKGEFPVIPHLMDILLREPLYHILNIFQTVEDLYLFMTDLPDTMDDVKKKDSVEEANSLKQTLSHFTRITEQIRNTERKCIPQTRDNALHLVPRKAGNLRLQKAFSHIEKYEDTHQDSFFQVCNEHLINGNIFKIEKKEAKLRQAYLFNALLVLCTVDSNSKDLGVRIIYKEKFFVRNFKHVRDLPGDQIEINMNDGSILTLQARNKVDKNEWLTAFIILLTRPILDQIMEQEETSDLNYNAILPSSYRFNEPDSPENITLTERGEQENPIILSGTLVKLVERVTYHKYADLNLVKQFLTTFRFFAKPHELLDLLIERYNIPVNIPEELEIHKNEIDKIETLKKLQKHYILPVQLRVINVMRHWIDKHFDDFEKDTELTKIMEGFFDSCKENEKAHRNTGMRKWIKSLERALTRQNSIQKEKIDSGLGQQDPVLWHLTEDEEKFSLLTLHPLELARQITLIENEYYRSITPLELLGPSKEATKESSLSKMIQFQERLIFWMRRSIVETPNLEERITMTCRVFELMEHMKIMNNFSGVFEAYSVIESAEVYRLDHTIKKQLKEKEDLMNEVSQWPHKNYKDYKDKLKNCEPPCIPFIGIYKTKIIHIQDGNKDVKENLINLSKFTMIADIISEIKLYQNEKYNFLLEAKIQAFLHSLDPFGDMSSEALLSYLYDKSIEIEPRSRPPTHSPPTHKWNLNTVPCKKRSNSVLKLGRTRESSLSDTSETGPRTPSKSTVSPGSTRSPTGIFSWARSDVKSEENSPLLPSHTPNSPQINSSDSDAGISPLIPPRQENIMQRSASFSAPPLPPRFTVVNNSSVSRSKSLNSHNRDRHSPVISPSDDSEGEYLDDRSPLFHKPLPPPAPLLHKPLPPPAPLLHKPLPPPAPKRTMSATISTLTSITETKERDSGSGTSGESIAEIQLRSHSVTIDEAPHGMIKSYTGYRGQPITALPPPYRGEPCQVPTRKKKKRLPPPISSVVSSPPPIPYKTRSPNEGGGPPPLPPKTSKPPPPPPLRPPLPPRTLGESRNQW